MPFSPAALCAFRDPLPPLPRPIISRNGPVTSGVEDFGTVFVADVCQDLSFVFAPTFPGFLSHFVSTQSLGEQSCVKELLIVEEKASGCLMDSLSSLFGLLESLCGESVYRLCRLNSAAPVSIASLAIAQR